MQTLSFFLFKLIAHLVGRLSDRNLYRLSNGITILIYHVIGYRKKVTHHNLTLAFPEKSIQEIKAIATQYYQNLSDIILETLASYQWSLERMTAHFRFTNTEILKPYLDKKRQLMVVASHTGNFEIGAVLIPDQIKAPSYSVYKSFSNQRLETEIVQKRARTGLHLETTKRIKPLIEGMEHPGILFLIADQNPSVIEKAIWVNFFNQLTAFVHGPARIAMEHNMPIFYSDTKKVKRGYYESQLSLLLEDPAHCTAEQITSLFATKLERSLRERPDNWLWSHKRWKWKNENGQISRVQ